MRVADESARTGALPHEPGVARTTHAGTDFQQIMHGLEKDMWPGSRPGRTLNGESPGASNANPPSSARCADALVTDREAVLQAWLGTLESSGEGNVEATISAPATFGVYAKALSPASDGISQTGAAPAPVPTKSGGSQKIPAIVCLTEGELTPCIDTLAARMHTAAWASRTPAYATVDTGRVSVLAGVQSPSLVVRYDDEDTDHVQLLRALRTELHRHGLGAVRMTVNGTEYPSTTETGGRHGH